jgi:hypothetical protein
MFTLILWKDQMCLILAKKFFIRYELMLFIGLLGPKILIELVI